MEEPSIGRGSGQAARTGPTSLHGLKPEGSLYGPNGNDMIKLHNDIRIGEPVFLRNLSIYAISGSSENGLEISSIDEIIKDARGRFSELETPDINRLLFNNQGNHPVLMLDGEEITGSLQDRIIASSTLVEERSTRDIPVICAEEGRWDEIGGFQTGYCSYPRIRAILSRPGRKENGLQKTVWKEIERKLTATKTLSTTSSMHDIYDNLEDAVNRYLEGFRSLNHETIGFVGTAGRQILGCDIFSDPKTYKKFEQRLIRSYALDAIEYQKSSRGKIDVDNFLQSVLQSLERKKKKSGRFSIKGDGLLGQGFIHKNRIIHLSAFPK